MFKHPVSKQHHKLGFDDTALHRRLGAFEILWRFLLESQIGHVLFAHDVKSKAFPGFQARSVVDSARRPYASARQVGHVSSCFHRVVTAIRSLSLMFGEMGA